MGVPFDYQVPISSGIPGPHGVRSQAENEVKDVASKAESFRMSADDLLAQGSALIDSAYAFDGAISDINFDASIGGFADIGSMPPVSTPSGFYRFGGIDGSVGEPPAFDIDEIGLSSFTKPSADAVTFAEPPATPANIGPPGKLPPQPVTVPYAPTTNITPLPLLEVGNAPARPPSLADFADKLKPIDVEPIDLGTIDLPDEADLERMQAMVERKFSRSPYMQRMLPQVMQAVGAMVGGSFVIDIDALDRGVVANLERAVMRHNLTVGTMWTRRRFVNPATAAGYNARVRQRILDEHRTEFDAAVERWRMKLLPAALQLATEAHAFAVEMEGELYDLDFEFLATEHQAMQSLYALAVARFNIGLLKLQVEAAKYRARVEQVVANSQAYRTTTQLARAAGQLNSALAAGYAAEQRAEGVEADAFAAGVDAGAAVLQAYDAQMQGVEMRAQALRANLVNYQAQVAEWGAGVERAKADYRRVRGRNRAVAVQNRARAAEMGADASEQTGVAMESRQSAAAAVATAARLRADSVSRSGIHMQSSFNNAVESAVYQASISDYRVDAAKMAGDAADGSQINDSSARANAATAATYGELARNAVRAAQLTQQYRIQLSDAARNLYDAVGRADAARVAGELSRYRGSLALRASGDLDYSTQVSLDTQTSTDVVNAGSNTRRTEWVAAEEAGS